MSLRFILVDVFTDRPFGGNQLAVFPEADDIDDRWLQPIARELDLSETTFVFPAKGDSAFRSMRIFTPEAEVPFAGHPIVGGAFALESEKMLPEGCTELSIELESGEVPIHLDRDPESGRLVSAVMTQQRPVFLGQYHRQESVAAALGLSPADIAITGLPCEVVSTGLPFHIVPVGGLDAMKRIRLNPGKLADIQDALGFSDLFVFTFDTVDPESTVHCRMFAPSFGIPEDPTTGSASGSLGAYLVKNRAVHVQPTTRIITEQGLEMGRPGRVVVEIDTSAGSIRSVRVGGGAVVVGEGRFHREALESR